jgi:tetratricopeptide (TPR) repeat protein
MRMLLACVVALLLATAVQPAAWVNAASLRMVGVVSPLVKASVKTGLTSPTVCGNAEAISAVQAAEVREFVRTAERRGGSGLQTVRRLVELNCSLGDFVAAEAAATQFEREHGRSVDPLFILARGWNTARSGNLTRAAEQWREIPDMLGMLLNWSQFDLFSERPAGGLLLARYALAVESPCQRAAWLEASATEALGDRPAALSIYQRAAEQGAAQTASPSCAVPPAEFAVTYGRALNRAGKYDDAIAWLDRAHAMAPDDAPTLVLLAEARWLGHTDAKGAEAAYREAIRVDPDHAWGYLGLASLFLTMRTPEQALPLLELAERHAGPAEREQPAILRGQALLELGQYTEALAILGRAEEINPGNGWAAYFIGQIFDAQGETAGAVTAYQRAARLLPDQPGVKAALTRANERRASQDARR